MLFNASPFLTLSLIFNPNLTLSYHVFCKNSYSSNRVNWAPWKRVQFNPYLAGITLALEKCKQSMIGNNFASLLLALTSTFAQLSTARNPSSSAASKCATELQGLLHEPETFSRSYLETIAEKFRAGAEQLFTSEADSFVSKFEQQWGVTVSISDPTNICGGNGGSQQCQSTTLLVSGVDLDQIIAVPIPFNCLPSP